MQLKPRLIPVLLLDKRGLYKTVKFAKPKYIGDPIVAMRIFNEKEVDEIVVLDYTCTAEKREPDYEMIEDFANEAFMPLAYGGGIQNLNQAKRIFDIGIEKIIVNSAFFSSPRLIEEIAIYHGAQSAVVSIDVKKTLFGGVQVFSHSGKQKQKGNIVDIILSAEQAGAGEVILNDIDRDGTFSGMNLELFSEIKNRVGIPVIICGGCRNTEDATMAIAAGAHAVAAGSMFVYNKNNTESVLINYPKW